MPRLLLLLLITCTLATSVSASPAPDGPSRGKAFLLSLAVPGLGHRYAHGGNWDGAASLFLAAETGLWLGFIGTALRYDRATEGYRTLAALRAGADVAGKDRTFFLTLSNYRSSDEFVEEQLRARAWNQVDYVDSRSYQWAWESEEDFQRFRSLREDAESLRRRRPIIAALLVGNRLLSGLLAIRQAGRADDLALSISPSPIAPDRLALNLQARF